MLGGGSNLRPQAQQYIDYTIVPPLLENDSSQLLTFIFYRCQPRIISLDINVMWNTSIMELSAEQL